MEHVDFEQAEAMGVSRPAYDEVMDILGHQPTLDELSTLLAMWESNGRQQSLFAWLRGQAHVTRRDEYLYSGPADLQGIREPRIAECLAIARQLSQYGPHGMAPAPPPSAPGAALALPQAPLLYMVGNVSSELLGSDYARRCLHLAAEPVTTTGSDDDCRYAELILSALAGASLLAPLGTVAGGGLFGSLLRAVSPAGFDILAPREVRLDAFLFGEEPGRYLVATSEQADDQFLLKLDEAGLNCCFLGRQTKGRILVDGFDFGPAAAFQA